MNYRQFTNIFIFLLSYRERPQPIHQIQRIPGSPKVQELTILHTVKIISTKVIETLNSDPAFNFRQITVSLGYSFLI